LAALLFALALTVADDPKVALLRKEIASKGWIVYSAKTDKGDWDLFLMRPDGSHRRNITNSAKVHGCVHSDGNRKAITVK
jgi:hypothetical protein